MKRSAIDDYAGPTTIGVDISAYQGEIDWAAVARSEAVFDGEPIGPVRYAIVRSGDGIQTRKHSRPDPTAVRNLVGASEAGLLAAAYHFVRAYHGAAAQVELILDVIRTAGVPVGFVGLDIEGGPDDSRTPDTDESRGAWWAPDGVSDGVPTSEVLAVVVEMRRLLRAAGHRCVVYTGVSWHWYVAQKRAAVPADIADLDLWTPYYTTGKRPKMPVGPNGEPYPWAEWRFWQFAGSKTRPGAVDGIRGVVDLNRFRGDADALREWWTRPAVPPESC